MNAYIILMGDPTRGWEITLRWMLEIYMVYGSWLDGITSESFPVEGFDISSV
jgi:hypothetical protein